MGWYSMQGTNVDPHNSDLFGWLPKEANSKSELVNLLIRAYDKTREEGNPVDDVEWVRYFTGWEANCGEIYLLSRSYANSIGYNGAFTFKNSDFMIVHGRNLDTTGFAPISKSKKLSKSFNDMVKSIRRSASGQIVKSEGNLEQYLNEKVEIAHGSGRIRMEYITLKEAIDKYGIESLGNPDDPRVFARCPKLNGFLKPMRPNDGFIARYESQSAYDSLSF